VGRTKRVFYSHRSVCWRKRRFGLANKRRQRHYDDADAGAETAEATEPAGSLDDSELTTVGEEDVAAATEPDEGAAAEATEEATLATGMTDDAPDTAAEAGADEPTDTTAEPTDTGIDAETATLPEPAV